MNMVPTGISQIIEALCKLLLGLGLALLILRSAIQPEDLRDRLSAAGALLGVSIGSILSVIYLFFNHRRTRQRQKTAADVPEPGSTILARLLKLAIPITLSSCTMSLVTLIDTNLVNGQLQNVFTSIQGGLSGISNSFLDIFPKSVTIFQNNLTAWQEAAALNPLTELNPVLDSTRSLYGAYQKTMSIYNLPFNLMVPFTACIVPGISACLARRDRLGAQRVTESAMRISALIALPCGFGLFALGGPIIQLLTVGNVDASIAGPLLSILGIASIFVCIQVVAAAILPGQRHCESAHYHHGHRRRHQAGHQLHAGGATRKIMIFGAPVGTLLCFAVISILNLGIIKRMVHQPPRYTRVFVKPFVASAIMAVAAWACHGLFARFLSGSFLKDAMATGGAILAAVVVYAILVLALRVISREDLELMPKGEKIAKILHIR